MEISSENIFKIAHLAKLNIDVNKSKMYVEELMRIITLIEKINHININVNNHEPMSHPQDAVLRLREDEVSKKNDLKEYQTIAPIVKNGLYLVPKVIK